MFKEIGAGEEERDSRIHCKDMHLSPFHISEPEPLPGAEDRLNSDLSSATCWPCELRHNDQPLGASVSTSVE